MSNQRLRYAPTDRKLRNFLMVSFAVVFFSFTTAVALLPWWLLYIFLQEEVWGIKGVIVIFLLFIVGIPLSIWYFYNLGYIAFMEKYFPQKIQIDKFSLQSWKVIYKKKSNVFASGKSYSEGSLSLCKRANKAIELELSIKPPHECDYFSINDSVILQLVFKHTSIELEKELLEYVFKIGTENISFFTLLLKNPNEEIISAFCNSPTVTVVYQNEGYDGFEVTYDITGFKDVYDMMLTYLPEIPREDMKYDL